MNWNPHLPESWSKHLGMLSVPLFDSKRTVGYPGTHVVLLDGEWASCTFSSVNTANDNAIADMLRWAWSSNVKHALVSEKSSGQLSVRRWDDPRRIETYSNPSRKTAENIIENLRDAIRPDATTVVSRALALFRVLRQNLEERQATPTFIVRAFNVLALWAATSDLSSTEDLTLGEIFLKVANDGWIFDNTDVSESVLAFPAHDFLQAILAQIPGHPYRLDTDLMLRHATGWIYQEAHRELTKPRDFHQSLLFDDIFSISPEEDARLASKDVHYTPPPFARALALEASRALEYTSDTIDIFDPACGSGVFLIEAAREFAEKGIKHIQLRGIDLSPSACEMANFNLQYHIRDMAERYHVIIESNITCGNSLEIDDWNAQIILMNPPFTSWDEMTSSNRDQVRSILGSLLHGRTDISTAFFHRAFTSIKPGGVTACILPASFLNSKSSEELRRAVGSNSEYSVRLIGRFTGFDYFSNATVEPGFVVVARSKYQNRPRIVLSPMRYADRALRMLRKMPSRDVVEPMGNAVMDLKNNNWSPQDTRILKLIKHIDRIPTVHMLFDVKLGVRTGDNQSFVINASERDELPNREHKYFRLAAGTSTIWNCTLWPSQYVFYPYNDYGIPTINSENDLERFVPEYLNKKLLPRKECLSQRAGIDSAAWWLLTRPRPTWQGATGPRLISAAFADIGKFALDSNGEYIVVQGNAWLWKGRAFSKKSAWLAYLAILNSPAFMLLFSHYCRKVQGGQYEAYAKYSNHVPIPDITTRPIAVVNRLAEMGKSMFDGWFPNIDDLDMAVAEAYGTSYDNFVAARPELDIDDVANMFLRLSRQCRRETAVLSNPRQIVAHPAYQQIVRMGKPAIPFIIEAMKNDGGFWFQAMSAITGTKPNGLRRSSDVASAIVQWSALAHEHRWL